MQSDCKDVCFFCANDVGRANLKKCSQCRLVKYCSKECQRAAWPVHKPRCVLGAATAQDKGSDFVAFSDAMSKWMAHWRYTLLDAGLHAMDLANHPPDRLTTHCVVIRLQHNPDAQNRARSFSMLDGGVMNRKDLGEAGQIGLPQGNVDALAKDSRSNNSLQVCLMCDHHIRVLWGQLPEEHLESTRSMTPVGAALLAALWEEQLIARIASGQPV